MSDFFLSTTGEKSDDDILRSKSVIFADGSSGLLLHLPVEDAMQNDEELRPMHFQDGSRLVIHGKQRQLLAERLDVDEPLEILFVRIDEGFLVGEDAVESRLLHGGGCRVEEIEEDADPKRAVRVEMPTRLGELGEKVEMR